MIKIENIDVFGWEAAIRGMRNPMNSWDKSDSKYKYWCSCLNQNEEPHYCENCTYDACNPYTGEPDFVIGDNDLKLMKQLSKAGNDHGKFLRMINVTFDVTCHHAWWAEFDTYKVGTVRNSCSKMHKIHVKEFTYDDFAHEGIDDVSREFGEVKGSVLGYINTLEWLRNKFNETQEKRFWRALIEMLPMGYNIKATIQLNYQVLKTIYFARRNHKLDEWREFCKWCETLPYFKDICIQEGDADD